MEYECARSHSLWQVCSLEPQRPLPPPRSTPWSWQPPFLPVSPPLPSRRAAPRPSPLALVMTAAYSFIVAVWVLSATTADSSKRFVQRLIALCRGQRHMRTLRLCFFVCYVESACPGRTEAPADWDPLQREYVKRAADVLNPLDLRPSLRFLM